MFSVLLFYIPAAFHEFDRQPIEQFRVRWPFAAGAGVVENFGETHAVKQIPETIDKDSRRLRMVFRRQPPRQVESRRPILARDWLQKMRRLLCLGSVRRRPPNYQRKNPDLYTLS